MRQWIFATLGGAAASILLLTSAAHAQSYPVKPVRIIAATTGTTGDLFARYLGQRLNERWAQPVIIENRSGAGATIASDYAAKAPPDGYTLHIGQLASHAAAVSLYRNLPYDPVKDFAPITFYAEVALAFVAHPSFPANSLREFIALAKNRPDAIQYGSASNGTGSHLTMEMLKLNIGARMVHVPYRGSAAATTALISGEVPVAALVLPNIMPHVKVGKVKAYAVTSKRRFAGAPDIPTASEAGLPGFESTGWFGMFAPARTPAELVNRLNRDIVDVLRSPGTRDWLLSQGAEAAPGTPAEFAAFINSETAKWKKVIETSGAKVD